MQQLAALQFAVIPHIASSQAACATQARHPSLTIVVLFRSRISAFQVDYDRCIRASAWFVVLLKGSVLLRGMSTFSPCQGQGRVLASMPFSDNSANVPCTVDSMIGVWHRYSIFIER